MPPSNKNPHSYSDYLSPLKLTLLVVNSVCFGSCLVLLVLGKENGSIVWLTIGTGLSLGAGFMGAIFASRENGIRGLNKK